MARLVYADAFVDGMTSVQLESKRDEILGKTDLLASFPELGSTLLPKSIREKYGNDVRKLVAAPFDIVYEYDSQNDTVHILGLVHQCAAY